MNATEYGQLLIFQTIAKEGSISACSRALGISVPAVSKALRNLEQRLGVPLSLILNDSETVIDAVRQGFGIGRIFEPQYERLADKTRPLVYLTT